MRDGLGEATGDVEAWRLVSVHILPDDYRSSGLVVAAGKAGL
jgi:hypothetical protein